MAEVHLPYEQQLETINNKVVHLFALVGEGIAAATHALLSDDLQAWELIAGRESTIDDLYQSAESLVIAELTELSPAGEDLRFLLSVLRILGELERSHDLCEHIARRAGRGLSEALTPRSRGLVQRMGTTVGRMWAETSRTYSRTGSATGVDLANMDEEVDEMHATLTAEISSGAMPLPMALDMALVARFYERLGDHAVNIARRVEEPALGSDHKP